MIRIVVACGGGIVTTTLVTDQIKKILRENNYQFVITPKRIVEIPGIKDEDLIVVTGKAFSKNNSSIPIMVGMSLFTGVEKAQFVEQFLSKVREIEGSK